MTDIKSPQKKATNTKDKKTISNTSIAISKNSKILAIFAIACTAIVGLVSELTQDKIKAQQQKELLKTLHAIITPARHDNNIANDCVMMSSPALGSNKIQKTYIARKNKEVIAVAMTTVAPDGYNGNIELIVGINIDGTVSGVRVLKHQETPGLGDKIELRKSDWIKSFTDKKLSSDSDSRWAVVKDNGMFDQFTGATITPRAIVKAVKNTLTYFTENKVSLLTRPNACENTTSTDIKTENDSVDGDNTKNVNKANS
jgi:electron transport complex protein RnfG